MTTRKLDITREHCPMTMVKTKLAMESLSEGEVLEVRLTEGEPLDNLPQACRDQGYEVLDITPEGEGIHTVRVRR